MEPAASSTLRERRPLTKSPAAPTETSGATLSSDVKPASPSVSRLAPPRRGKLREYAVFAAVLFVTAGVRFYRLGQPSSVVYVALVTAGA